MTGEHLHAEIESSRERRSSNRSAWFGTHTLVSVVLSSRKPILAHVLSTDTVNTDDAAGLAAAAKTSAIGSIRT